MAATCAGLGTLLDLAGRRGEHGTERAKRIVRRGIVAGLDRFMGMASLRRIGRLLGPRRH